MLKFFRYIKSHAQHDDLTYFMLRCPCLPACNTGVWEIDFIEENSELRMRTWLGRNGSLRNSYSTPTRFSNPHNSPILQVLSLL